MCLAPMKKLLTRFYDINAKLGEDLSADAMERALDELARVQEQIAIADAA